MILQDICKKVKYEDISKRMLELYPNQDKLIDAYQEVFTELLSLEIESVDNMKLCITHVISDYDQTEYEDVHGKDGSFLKDFDDKDYVDELGNKTEAFWALEFQTWAYWVSLPVDEETLKNYSELDIVVHCLWEMTFCGFSQEEIEIEKDSLENIVEGIKSGEIETYPFENLFDEFFEK